MECCSDDTTISGVLGTLISIVDSGDKDRSSFFALYLRHRTTRTPIRNTPNIAAQIETVINGFIRVISKFSTRFEEERLDLLDSTKCSGLNQSKLPNASGVQ